ncbi:hypothetical protein [Leptospira kanakyensis]|uniref:Uncharacterized protein n=1 Tax=Leptospira kanakyensis TaxID=2484968 RepID=A0A6N4Q7D4_9LEPT|nr:hypothetical protein [Leptospira kanakyensis]TGK49464.1 hypothetical protein EHQ11_15700 [Leptospira kanakyensis]TGK71065.1 hypothetical protein EHQ18_08330 [Leptospira kanakyensis]
MNLFKLTDIPYLDHKELSSKRGIPSLTFYDEETWHIWVQTPDGLIKIDGYPAEGTYFSKNPVTENDVYLEFFNFLGQKALRKEILKPVHGIQDDIMNICASLKKISLLYQLSKDKSLDVSRMVITELEYLINVCRSIFDLLQEIISELWETVTLNNPNIKKKKLNDKFRKMVIENEEILKPSIIQERFSIPEILANFYHDYAEFFQILRKYRDNLVHHGSSLEFIFTTERGFAVRDSVKPFSLFKVWNEKHKLPNSLASLRVPVAYMVFKTLSACEHFATSIQKCIVFPNEIVPNYKLLLRMSHGNELMKLKKIIDDSLWLDE